MGILSKALYLSNAIPNKVPIVFITEVEISILTFLWKHKIQQIAKATLNTKSKAGSLTTSNIKLYYRA
jgi:hypothetical protein